MRLRTRPPLLTYYLLSFEIGTLQSHTFVIYFIKKVHEIGAHL